jgi:dipeptidase E
VRLLLISSSTLYGSGYLDHCAGAIGSFVAPAAHVLFVPFALRDHDAYTARVRARFNAMGLTLASVHEARAGAAAAVERAEAIFIGGGNTFRLLDALWRHALVEPIRHQVRDGIPYIGSSAGSNVACPSIATTNDMPIVQPPSFSALNLIPFNINPHYHDAMPGSTHMGETREQRIAEFQEETNRPVVGLREGAWLVVDGATVTVGGSAGVRLFRRGEAAAEWPPGSRLDFLLV